MKTSIHLSPVTSMVAVVIATIVLSYSPPSHSCGLEPSVNGGFTISYPGSLEVAIAVADARNNGLLPQANPNAIPDMIRLQQMLTDLQQLQTLLDKGRGEISDDFDTPFSLVLIGPGLWSHFHITPDSVTANFHTNGPLTEKVVVLTHPTALRAMLDGKLSIEQATRLGLIAYSGTDTAAVQRTFETSLQIKT
ncbi:MAG: hypothetical protein QNK19_11740 [Xanthomonadales bacterium]|nr:hypothetical protein [Xanthomonadales bacterium]